MRIFAIKDDSFNEDVTFGYLIYYENAKAFYIELPDGADKWDTPLLLASFAERGEFSINSYWSRLWVEQRIIPPERQNIGQILKTNGLDEYDEFEMLMLSSGRCAQDDYYLKEIKEDQLPGEIADRWKYKLEDVIPMQSQRLLLFFRNGEVKIADISTLGLDEDYLKKAELQPDGYGVIWGNQSMISDRELYDKGVSVPLSAEDFYTFVKYRIVNSAEAADILGCSRQNIDDLTRRGRLHPIRIDSKNRLYLRNEIIQRRKK